MSSFIEGRSSAIVETSLTELAFIFFFILLVFMGWKFSDYERSIEEKDKALEAIEKKIEETTEILAAAAKSAGFNEAYDPQEIIKSLKLAQEAAEAGRKAEERTSQLVEAIEAASDMAGVKEKTPEKTLERLLREAVNTKGQNINLREKIEKIGNGLDHQPCWENPVTGVPEYVFDAIINETTIDVLPGWPESRHTQAINDPHINTVIGNYSSNKEFWESTKNLYNDSVKDECRHFVRIFDHAESKKSFKLYLTGIENHFYKYLSKGQYEKE